jgi:DNA end-binding protein Ku
LSRRILRTTTKKRLTELINAKRQGKTIGKKPRPSGEKVVDLMAALKQSIAQEAAPKAKKRKAAAGQKEMLMSIAGKKPAEKKGRQTRARNGQKEGRLLAGLR